MSAPVPPAIDPETKNWTWVLERRCDQCGYDAAAFDIATTGAALVDNAVRWEAVLTRPDARVRPRAGVWSSLEYGCHVRDVLRTFDHRLRRMIVDDEPDFEDWDPDAWAVVDRYDAQDPAVVARLLRAHADALVATYATVTDWSRRGVRSDGAEFTIDTFTRYLLHDLVHHIADVGG